MANRIMLVRVLIFFIITTMVGCTDKNIRRSPENLDDAQTFANNLIQGNYYKYNIIIGISDTSDIYTMLLEKLNSIGIIVNRLGDTIIITMNSNKYFEKNTTNLKELYQYAFTLIAKLIEIFPKNVVKISSFPGGITKMADKNISALMNTRAKIILEIFDEYSKQNHFAFATRIHPKQAGLVNASNKYETIEIVINPPQYL